MRRGRSRRSEILPLLTLALVALPYQSTPERPGRKPREQSEELQRLVAFEDQLSAALFTTRPWLAPVGDEADLAPELGRIIPVEHDAWVNELRYLESTIDSIDEGNLPGARGRDARWLASWVRQERILMSTLKPALNNPWFYVENVRLSLAAAARPAASGIVTTVRIRNLAERLKRVSGVWSEAEARLEDLSRPVCRRASDRAAELMRTIREDYAPLGENLAESERQGFEDVCKEAYRSTEQLRDWLHERAIVTAPLPRYLKAKHWKLLVEYATGWQIDLDDLRLMLLMEISDRRAAVGKHAHTVEVPDAALFPGRIETKTAEFANELAGRARDKDLAIAPLPEFEVRARVSHGKTLDLPYWERPNLDRWRLVVTLPSPVATEAQSLTRRDRLSAAARPSLAARYGPLGEALLMRTALSSGSKSRIQMPNLMRRRAFGLYALDWTLRTGVFATRDERTRALFERELLVEAARLLAAVEMYQGETDLEIAIANFAAHTGVDRETAAWEVHQTALDPLHGCAFLIYLDTLEQERAFAEEFDATEAVRETLRLLLSHTSAPLRELTE